MYKVSVIIPVYNAEDTLKNAVDSVVNQTIGFENIELILVDDNSSDGSKEIISDYANEYDNVKPVFLSKNSGSPSTPRNVGIDNATAPYLMFLDNDDGYFSDYCEVLYNSIEKNDVDIVNCNHASVLNNQVYIPSFIENIDFEEEVRDDRGKMFLKLACWGNIFNASLIKQNNIRFPTTLYEDGVFYLHCLLKTQKPVVRLPNYPGYLYLIENDDSITHKASLKTLTRFLEGYEICGRLLEENNRRDVEQELFSNFVRMAIFILIKLDNVSEGIKALYEFESRLDFDISFGSKPLDLVNSKIMNKQFGQAKLLLKSMGLVYNNKKIKNRIFIDYSNLKPLD